MTKPFWRDLPTNLERVYRGVGSLLGAAVQPLAWAADLLSADATRRARAGRWMRRNYHWVVIVVGTLAFLALAMPALWSIRGAIFAAIDRLETEIGGADNADAIRNLAYTIGALLGGIALLAAIPFQLIKTWINERQTDAAEQGLITDRFTKAVGQLGEEKTVKYHAQTVTYTHAEDPKRHKQKFLHIIGQPFAIPSDVDDVDYGDVKTLETTSPNIEVRLGAIYALERIARDSERDHVPVMETLCAYIRENANPDPPKDFPEPPLPERDGDPDPEGRVHRIRERGQRLQDFFGEVRPLRADIKAAFAVIARRTERQKAVEREHAPPFRLDFRGANLQSLDLSGVDIRGADLSGARLEGARLLEGRLEGADLRWARLEGARLIGARLDGADLSGARLEGADLRGARLEGADLRVARLDGADLRGARLEGADLRVARLEGADLRVARLDGGEPARGAAGGGGPARGAAGGGGPARGAAAIRRSGAAGHVPAAAPDRRNLRIAGT